MSDFKSTFGKSIEESFLQYHKDNPHIYAHFCDYALAWLKTGAKKISSKQIIGRIRWFLDVESKGEEAKSFKCNDAFTAYFSRMFVEQFPEYSERFEFRNLRA